MLSSCQQLLAWCFNNNLSIACRHFAHFAAVIAEAPGQCLRYCFDEGAEPLWPSRTNIPTLQEIPACQHCGSNRRFEFQVRMLCLCCVFHRQSTDQSVHAQHGCILLQGGAAHQNQSLRMTYRTPLAGLSATLP